MNLFKSYIVDTHKQLFFVISFFIVSACVGQTEEVRRITKTLCEPSFHGRGYVNSGDKLAADFIAAEFEKIGLSNYGPSYFQSFSFPVNCFPGEAQFAYPNKELVIGKDVLVDAGSAGFYGDLTPKYFTAAQLLDQDYLIAEIHDIISKNNYNAAVIDLTTMDKDTLARLRSFKYELAQFFPVIELTNEKFTWSVSQEQHKHLIFQMRPEAFQKDENLKVNLTAQFIERHETQNVIGYIPAKKKTNKTIVFTAHYDHLGRMGLKTYFPGANDNASGTAMIISMAQHYKANPPKKFNVVFIAFAGEEAGLLGSKFYVENPLFELEDISFLINLDIMGSGEEGITVVNGSIFKKQFDQLVAINKKENLLKTVNPRGYAANSDHYWFTDKGVPAIFIYTQGPNKNYHDVFDTYDNLTFAETVDITTLLVKFVDGMKKR